jgi:UDP-2,4-diacetamido-2,4,6-trideoxy-beta-L-altropyranose hydrolase
MNTLVFRADAGTSIGTGHVMRCLALAQAWQDAGGQSVFASNMMPIPLEATLLSETIHVEHIQSLMGSRADATELATITQANHAQWVVIDGYHFGAEYQRIIKSSGLNLIFLDDNAHSEHYFADYILNQNIHAHQSLYPHCESYTKLLLGTDYVLLRRQFLKHRNWKRTIPDVAKNILITLGGSDPNNVTVKAIHALQQIDLDGLTANVVVGAHHPYINSLESALQTSPQTIQLMKNVEDMPQLMMWADVAVSGGGITSLEAAFMGLPSILLVLADNQKASAQTMSRQSICTTPDHANDYEDDQIYQALTALLFDRNLRETYSRNASNLVDGNGTSRVLQHIHQIPVTEV